MSSLTLPDRIRITEIAASFLGTPRRSDFKCIEFVREVYRRAGINRYSDFQNITLDQKAKPPFGETITLLEKGVTNKRWSHIVIAFPFNQAIHMSYYWGEKVTLTPWEVIWERYDLAK